MGQNFVGDNTNGRQMKVLESFTKKAGTSLCRGGLVTHVLPTAVGYIEALNRVFPLEFVIAIPYSSDPHSVKKLKDSGIRVYEPASAEEIFFEARRVVEEALKKSGEPLIVQEVGGYLAEYTASLSKYRNFFGIVEDTNNGHWRYVSAGFHQLPVVSIALSPVKDIEDTAIGDAVAYSLEKVYRGEFCSILQGSRSGILGYGKIGKSSAIALKGRESRVSVYDIDPTKLIRARFEGYGIMPLRQLLETSDLVIGCSGKTSVRREDVKNIRHNCVLVSASSKQVEFEVAAFEEDCSAELLSPLVKRYVKKDGNSFYLLNNGAPINFRDNSVLGSILDMVYSELFLCMNLLAQGGVSQGLHLSPPALHAAVGKAWLSAYSDEFYCDQEDRLWSFPKTMEDTPRGGEFFAHMQDMREKREGQTHEELLCLSHEELLCLSEETQRPLLESVAEPPLLFQRCAGLAARGLPRPASKSAVSNPPRHQG